MGKLPPISLGLRGFWAAERPIRGTVVGKPAHHTQRHLAYGTLLGFFAGAYFPGVWGGACFLPPWKRSRIGWAVSSRLTPAAGAGRFA